MPQALDHWSTRQPLQVVTRFTQADASYPHIPYAKLFPDQMIQRHVARDDVPPSIPGRQPKLIIPLSRFDRFRLDERQLKRGFRFEKRALLQEVAVAFESPSRHRFCLLDTL